MPIPRIFLTFLIIITASFLATAGALPPSDSSQPSHVLRVQGSVFDLMEGYHGWMVQHSAAVSKQPNAPSGQEQPPALIHMPSVDLYSPAGVAIFHGADDEANAAFLHTLVGSGVSKKQPPLKEARPTLKEALSLLPQLAPYRGLVNETKGYTLIALTWSNTLKCQQQNKAIQALEHTRFHENLQIIEVDLYK